MNEKIYISGKISGMPEEEAKELFASAFLKLKLEGFNPVNPFWIKPLFGIRKYWCYMFADIRELLKCEDVYMLKNWHESRGARIELAVAALTRKRIVFEAQVIEMQKKIDDSLIFVN